MRTFLALFLLVSCATAGTAAPAKPAAKFYVAGEIHDDLIPFAIEYLLENKQAEIVLSTTGGSRLASETIAAAIKKHGNVRCVVRDKAMSGGFGILQACRVRAMKRAAVLGTHEPRMTVPQAIDRQLAAVIIQALETAATEWNATCRARLKLSAAEYEAKVKGQDWVMSAAEALAVGAVDQVIP